MLGPRPLVAGHELGAEVLLRATGRGLLAPGRLVLMPTRLHRRPQSALPLRRLRPLVRAGGLPGANRLAGHAARGAWRPKAAEGLIARAVGAAGARDLLRHATADIGGNADLARSWSRFARSWPPRSSEREVLTILRELRCPTLLLWADEDALHPVEGAREALDLLRDGQLRVLDRTGFLLSYDDPVGVARELVAFCG